MSADLLNWMESWPSLTVLVIGEAMLDSYLTGRADRLCREAPAPVVDLQQRRDVPGGAANTAANLASLGAKVVFVSVIGADAEGDRLQHQLHHHGVSTAHLVVSETRTTLAKQRILAGSQILLRLDQGSTDAISPDLEHRVIDQLATHIPRCHAIIVSDYAYGILTPGVIDALTKFTASRSLPVLIDARRLATYRSVQPTAVKPNYEEAIQLLGLPKQAKHRAEQIAPYGDRMLTLTGAAIAAVTLDCEGAIVFERGQAPGRMMVKPAPAEQTSGAGDTFMAALALSLAAGAPTAMAMALATAATAVVVQQPGTSTCSHGALRQSLRRDRSIKIIQDPSDLASQVQQYRTCGKRIVFTNGCFDILHPGHVSYLTQARALGDVLIVGVNSDESVQQLKGTDRPVNPLSDRLAVLAALSCVDHVVPFADLTPHALIRAIQPHVFVKGGDYTRDTLPEAALVESLGGVVHILPYVHNCSTTRLIQQIRRHYG